MDSPLIEHVALIHDTHSQKHTMTLRVMLLTKCYKNMHVPSYLYSDLYHYDNEAIFCEYTNNLFLYILDSYVFQEIS